MDRDIYDVYGCSVCEREIMTGTGNEKEYFCCDLPMKIIEQGSEYEKAGPAEWSADKLVAVLDGAVGFTGNDYTARTVIYTPTIEVRLLAFKSGQETIYEIAGNVLSLYIIEGSGILALGNDDLEVGKSSVVVVPGGMLWGIKNNNNSPLVVLQTINNKNKLLC